MPAEAVVALLLDEMLSAAIAEQLRARGHDVVAVVEDRVLAGLPDDELLARATAGTRALVTANIKDFVLLDQRHKAAGLEHYGLILISTRTFPQDQSFVGTVVRALDAPLTEQTIASGDLTFLRRASDQ